MYQCTKQNKKCKLWFVGLSGIITINFGWKFILHADHRPLIYFFGMTNIIFFYIFDTYKNFFVHSIVILLVKQSNIIASSLMSDKKRRLCKKCFHNHWKFNNVNYALLLPHQIFCYVYNKFRFNSSTTNWRACRQIELLSWQLLACCERLLEPDK